MENRFLAEVVARANVGAAPLAAIPSSTQDVALADSMMRTHNVSLLVEVKNDDVAPPAAVRSSTQDVALAAGMMTANDAMESPVLPSSYLLKGTADVVALAQSTSRPKKRTPIRKFPKSQQSTSPETTEVSSINSPIRSASSKTGFKGVYKARGGRYQAQVGHRAMGGYNTAWVSIANVYPSTLR